MAGLPGGMEWVIIIGIVLLLFGAAAIPKLARSMGRAQGEFQKARQEFQKEIEVGKSGSDEAHDPDEEDDAAKQRAS